MINLVDSSLEFWLTTGRYTEKFEKELNPLFVQVLINLCLSKETEKISQVVQFVNELINSKCDKDANLKELLTKRIEEVKSNSEFNFQPKNKIRGNLEKINLNNPPYLIENYISFDTPLSLYQFAHYTTI